MDRVNERAGRPEGIQWLEWRTWGRPEGEHGVSFWQDKQVKSSGRSGDWAKASREGTAPGCGGKRVRSSKGFLEGCWETPGCGYTFIGARTAGGEKREKFCSEQKQSWTVGITGEKGCRRSIP